MADENTSKEGKGEEAKADAGITASKEGDKLDTVLAHLDSLHRRMDAYEKGKETKADAEDCDMADAEGEIEQKGETKALADKKRGKRADAESEEESEMKKADKARKDAAEEKEEEAKADAARADSAALAAQIAELQRRIPVEMPDADRARFVEAQSKAERVAQAFGDSAGAPRWVNGETLIQYRQRLLSKVKAHSPAWKDADLSRVDSTILDVAETQVYADAMNAATHPASVEGGALRMVVETDDTGRRIRKFFGDPEACWGPFKQPSRIVTGWTTKFN